MDSPQKKICVGRRGAGRVLFVYMGVCSLLSARVGAPAELAWRRVVRYILKIVFFFEVLFGLVPSVPYVRSLNQVNLPQYPPFGALFHYLETFSVISCVPTRARQDQLASS